MGMIAGGLAKYLGTGSMSDAEIREALETARVWVDTVLEGGAPDIETIGNSGPPALSVVGNE
jgi:hypothetical protein